MDYKLELIIGVMFSGKCQAKGTPILMFDGSIKLIEDIQLGEQLMGDDSTPRDILSTTKGFGKMYKVIPVYGEPYIVNYCHTLCFKVCFSRNQMSFDSKGQRYRVQYLADHETKSCSFTVKNYGTKELALEEAKSFSESVETTKKGDILDISVEDYLQKSKSWQKLYKGYYVSVEFEEKEISLDPYMLGIWLGDGTSSKPQITNVDPEILSYFETNLPSTVTFRKGKGDNNISYYISGKRRIVYYRF